MATQTHHDERLWLQKTVRGSGYINPHAAVATQTHERHEKYALMLRHELDTQLSRVKGSG